MTRISDKDVVFLDSDLYKDLVFICECGWSGSHVDLDVCFYQSFNFVVCPSCRSCDIRILNDE